MFPPSHETAKEMNLHYSMRILPHDQNSGGFFVALLRKNEDFRWKHEGEKGVEGEGEGEEELLRSHMP
jgi:tRNA (cytosine34-C5)-methyltransferase